MKFSYTTNSTHDHVTNVTQFYATVLVCNGPKLLFCESTRTYTTRIEAECAGIVQCLRMNYETLP